MDKKKIITIILLIIFCILISYILYQTVLSPKDNVVEIDNITFNTTNATDFKLNSTNESLGLDSYRSDNGTGTVTVQIYKGNNSEYGGAFIYSGVESSKTNLPSQEINGIVMYTTSASVGEHVGEPRYIAYIYNKDLDMYIVLSSPNTEETVKMASSLKFN